LLLAPAPFLPPHTVRAFGAERAEKWREGGRRERGEEVRGECQCKREREREREMERERERERRGGGKREREIEGGRKRTETAMWNNLVWC
jgi:hypothetical protein